MEYEEDLKVDKYNLHTQWEDQPILYAKWAEKHVYAIRVRDRIKEDLDILTAELDLEIRTVGMDGVEPKKITETAIKGAILLDKGHKELVQKLNDANHDAEILAVAKTAFYHRKAALSGLTELFVTNYYTVDTKKELPEHIKKMRGMVDND